MTWALVVCAVLSGVAPEEIAYEHEHEEVRRMLSLATNTTSDGLDTGAIVAIVLGGVATLILLVGFAWWLMNRNAMASAYPRSAPSDTRTRRDGFRSTLLFGESVEATEMPLLRLQTASGQAVRVV